MCVLATLQYQYSILSTLERLRGDAVDKAKVRVSQSLAQSMRTRKASAILQITCHDSRTDVALDIQLKALAAVDGVAQRLFCGVADVVAKEVESCHRAAGTDRLGDRCSALIADLVAVEPKRRQ